MIIGIPGTTGSVNNVEAFASVTNRVWKGLVAMDGRITVAVGVGVAVRFNVLGQPSNAVMRYSKQEIEHIEHLQ